MDACVAFDAVRDIKAALPLYPFALNRARNARAKRAMNQLVKLFVDKRPL